MLRAVAAGHEAMSTASAKAQLEVGNQVSSSADAFACTAELEVEAAIAVAVEKASDRSAAQAFAFARECMQMHQHSTAELEGGSKGRSLLKGVAMLMHYLKLRTAQLEAACHLV